jgi:Xaa-Pro dipeptidase
MRKNLIFTKDEYQQRVRKTKELMDKDGMEMLLVMDPANMN